MENETVKKEHLQPQTPEDDDKETEVETISEVLQTEDNGTEAKFVKETKKKVTFKKENLSQQTPWDEAVLLQTLDYGADAKVVLEEEQTMKNETDEKEHLQLQTPEGDGKETEVETISEELKMMAQKQKLF